MIFNSLAELIASYLAPSFKSISSSLAEVASDVSTIKNFIGAGDVAVPGPAAAARIWVGNIAGQIITLQGETMLLLTDTQQAPLAVTFADAKGAAVTLPSPPVWSASDPAVITVTASADGLTATVASVAPGTAQVNVVGTNADGKTAAGTLDVT